MGRVGVDEAVRAPDNVVGNKVLQPVTHTSTISGRR